VFSEPDWYSTSEYSVDSFSKKSFNCVNWSNSRVSLLRVGSTPFDPYPVNLLASRTEYLFRPILTFRVKTHMQQHRTISAKQLTFLMLGLIFGPVACGLLLFWNSAPLPEPQLPALVRFDTTWIEKKDEERRLVPCIMIKNDSNSDWGKLSIGLNEQFYSTGNMRLSGNEEVAIPLETFIARNGSIRFPVGTRPISLVTIFAQMESGARGVVEIQIEDDTSKTWLAPKSTPSS
jgi:hypothetical protein